MSDARNGGHPFPIDERPLDKDRYPTTLPTSAADVELLYRYAPPGPALEDFALHAYPKNINNEEILHVPWSEGIRKDFSHVKYHDEDWFFSPAYRETKHPAILHVLAGSNTMHSFFHPYPLSIPSDETHFPIYKAKLDLFIGLRPEFTILAKYSQRCNNQDIAPPKVVNNRWETYKPLPEMTREEKKALLKVITTFSDAYAGPEILTRFVNPTGVMADTRARYKTGMSWDHGINAYFSGMLQLPQLHFSYFLSDKNKRHHLPFKHHCVDRSIRSITDRYFSTEKPSDEEASKLRGFFFEHTKDYYLDEAARLLGLGARQWGLDKPQEELSNSDLRDRMERFYRYVFSAKCLEMLNANDKENIIVPESILNADVEEAMKYPGYVQTLRDKGIPTLQAETALEEQIKIKAKDPDIYKECEQGHTKKYAISRILNRCLIKEKKHALDFLLSDDGKGQEAVFSR